MNKAGCLSLVSNAVLACKTHHIQQIVDELRAEGLDIPSEHLQKIFKKTGRIRGQFHIALVYQHHRR